MKFNPIYYHLQHREMTEDLPFWKRMAKEMGNPILELGCGTGRVLHPLMEAAYDVSGIDISYQALQVTNLNENRFRKGQTASS